MCMQRRSGAIVRQNDALRQRALCCYGCARRIRMIKPVPASRRRAFIATENAATLPPAARSRPLPFYCPMLPLTALRLI